MQQKCSCARGVGGDGGDGGDGQLHGTGGKQRSHRFCVWAGTSWASGARAGPLYCKEIQGVQAHAQPCGKEVPARVVSVVTVNCTGRDIGLI